MPLEALKNSQEKDLLVESPLCFSFFCTFSFLLILIKTRNFQVERVHTSLRKSHKFS